MATHIHIHVAKKTADQKVKDDSFPSIVTFKGEHYSKTGKTGKNFASGEKSAEYVLESYNMGTSKIDKRVWRTLSGKMTQDAKAKDSSLEELKRELRRLENRMDAYTSSAPLKEKTATAERLKEIRKLLGTKDAVQTYYFEGKLEDWKRKVKSAFPDASFSETSFRGGAKEVSAKFKGEEVGSVEEIKEGVFRGGYRTQLQKSKDAAEPPMLKFKTM